MPSPPTLAFAMFALAVSIAGTANAISIANIDQTPHRVQVTPSAGKQAYVLEIPVNRTVHLGTMPLRTETPHRRTIPHH